MQPIKLSDGSELVPLEQADKEALEAELKVVLDKYNAAYLPALKEEETITSKTTTAALFLLKKVPAQPHGETTETPQAD